MTRLLVWIVLAAAPMGTSVAGPPPGEVSIAGPRPAEAAPAPPPHDLHLTSGSAAVEGQLVITRIRFFKDDLEAALRGSGAGADFVMADDPAVDAAFLEYLGERYVVTVGGERLQPVLIAKGEDELDREPVWWYAVQHRAPEAVRVFRVRNTLLLELYADQRNIVKFVRFPEEEQRTYAFARGEEEFEIRF